MKIFLPFSFIASMLILTSACYSTGKSYPDATAPPPPKIILETDILHAKPGFTGKVLGATVTESKIDPEEEQQIVDINVPLDPDRVDQVQVISESGEPLKQQKTAEILRNYETDSVGVTIYISRQKNLGFKLRLIDNNEDN